MPTTLDHLPRLSTQHLLTVASLTRADLDALFNTARTFKADPAPFSDTLRGKSVALIFEKPSLRTRVSFEAAVHRLGGQPITLDHSKHKLGERESIKDEAKTLERYVHAVAARVYSHESLAEFAHHSAVPVINALSDRSHPCQALADYLTLLETLGTLDGARLCFIGDGNNVCHSLMAGAALLGVHMTVITPKGCEPSGEAVKFAADINPHSKGSLAVSTDPRDIQAGFDAVYTDCWTSMGNESADGEHRRALFTPYQVNTTLMQHAARSNKKPAYFMHCLPAHRGEEVTDDVIDAPTSIVYDQAENRLHIQAAILAHLLSPTTP